VISPGGTGLIYTTASSRVSYGLSRNGYVPVIYERTDRRGVPWFGLLTAFVIGCICFLPFPSWRSLVGLITSASVLMYAAAPLALGVFRRKVFPLWWDMVAVAVFSLAIYFWAQRVSLPAQKIHALIDGTASPTGEPSSNGGRFVTP
jgi:amino acid transporter